MSDFSVQRRAWTRDETIIALGLYFQIPFAKISSRNVEIQELARLMHRSPASLSMKMDNLGRFDPTLQAKGFSSLKNGSKSDKAIWDEFAEHRDILSEKYADLRQRLCGEFPLADDGDIKTPPGFDAVRVTKYRVNQTFFRVSVLSAYNYSCCITGIQTPQLLIASHIKPWAKCDDGEDRTNSQNGLCLNALHDRAFDKGLFTLDSKCKVVLSKSLRDAVPRDVYKEYFVKYDGIQITLPTRGRPAEEFLEYHRDNIFCA